MGSFELPALIPRLFWNAPRLELPPVVLPPPPRARVSAGAWGGGWARWGKMRKRCMAVAIMINFAT